MPTWRPRVGKGSGRGGQTMEWGTRVIIFMMLAQAVPPAAIGVIIVAIVIRQAHSAVAQPHRAGDQDNPNYAL